ncbi:MULTISPECIES: hypothetical protein [unclassified Delftia]|uniref:hypothetical protein n=1 Tax=unclassified Delftia TaxID=2613839 RepID=UPI0019001FB0|nr:MULTISPECIES: hypothetical protein [unclassified Delftia]MBK0114918.1 hypothetical protein [Delftia sp. S65]MBK0120849.1 hypothetical protein [Delftia sp. S67]MBK0130635.1 hypothetical protein [Delftia sp. S66]
MSSGRLRLIAGLLLSLLLHGALLWQGLAPDIARPGTGQAEEHRLQVVWVETPMPMPTPTPAPSPAPAAARPGPAPASPPTRRPDTAAVAPPSRQSAGAAKAMEEAATAAAPQAPVPADTEAAPDTARSARAMGRLLDSAAGREAVQSAARQGLVRPQIHAQREDPLASGMREAAQGDCMKGEFKGGGMSLLSLPMLAAAALKGECSR